MRIRAWKPAATAAALSIGIFAMPSLAVADGETGNSRDAKSEMGKSFSSWSRALGLVFPRPVTSPNCGATSERTALMTVFDRHLAEQEDHRQIVAEGPRGDGIVERGRQGASAVEDGKQVPGEVARSETAVLPRRAWCAHLPSEDAHFVSSIAKPRGIYSNSAAGPH